MEIGLESLISESLGFNYKTDNPSTNTTSVENFDIEDSIKEMQESVEKCMFVNCMYNLQAHNNEEKLNMLRKMKRIYNNSSIQNKTAANSLESFYENVFSVEAENNKVKEFFGRIWDGIKKVFNRIFEFFKGIFTKIKDWITGLFNKNKEDKLEQDKTNCEKTLDKEEIRKRFEVALGACAAVMVNITESVGSSMSAGFKKADSTFKEYASKLQVKIDEYQVNKALADEEKERARLQKLAEKAAAKVARDAEREAKRAHAAKEQELINAFKEGAKAQREAEKILAKEEKEQIRLERIAEKAAAKVAKEEEARARKAHDDRAKELAKAFKEGAKAQREAEKILAKEEKENLKEEQRETNNGKPNVIEKIGEKIRFLKKQRGISKAFANYKLEPMLVPDISMFKADNEFSKLVEFCEKNCHTIGQRLPALFATNNQNNSNGGDHLNNIDDSRKALSKNVLGLFYYGLNNDHMFNQKSLNEKYSFDDFVKNELKLPIIDLLKLTPEQHFEKFGKKMIKTVTTFLTNMTARIDSISKTMNKLLDDIQKHVEQWYIVKDGATDDPVVKSIRSCFMTYTKVFQNGLNYCKKIVDMVTPLSKVRYTTYTNDAAAA
jgi:hypothetical protein